MDAGQTLDERSPQTVSTSFNVFKNKENVESMLNESLNQFKFDSTLFQQAFNIFYAFNNVQDDLFKCPRHLVQQLCWTPFEANVETWSWRALRVSLFWPWKGVWVLVSSNVWHHTPGNNSSIPTPGLKGWKKKRERKKERKWRRGSIEPLISRMATAVFLCYKQLLLTPFRFTMMHLFNSWVSSPDSALIIRCCLLLEVKWSRSNANILLRSFPFSFHITVKQS